MLFDKTTLLEYLNLANLAYEVSPTLPKGYSLEGMIEVNPAVTAKLLADEESMHFPLIGKAFPLDRNPWGFFAIKGDTAYACIRGTQTELEWAADAAARLVPLKSYYGDDVPPKSALRVHEGFQLVEGALDASLDGLVALAASRGVENYVYICHSLGCSVGVLHRANSGLSASGVSVVMFAPPRAGNPAFSTWWNSITPNSVAVVNKPDEVPRLPPEILGFGNIGAERLELDGAGDFFHLKEAHSLTLGYKPGLEKLAW